MKVVALDLDPSSPIGPQLTAILREMIVRNQLPPGSRISETEIARQFHTSRQPVREVFIKLAGSGLLEVRPQRGTVVRKIDPAEVLDARFVREAVEADIVRLLAGAPDPALLADLRDQLAVQARIARDDAAAFIAADETFHRTLALGAGKGRVWDILTALKSQMDRVRYLSFGLSRQDRLIRQHSEIVDRIGQGDVAGAEAATRRHLRGVLDDLPDIMRANPEAFSTAGPDGDVDMRSTQRRTP